MLTCPEAERLIARYADDPAAMSASARLGLDSHIESCAGCRLALEEQQRVAKILRARPELPVPPGFSVRVAARIEREGFGPPGWLDIANWRAWTVGLAPLAAVLLLGIYLDLGAGTTNGTRDIMIDNPQTFDGWMTSSAGTTTAAVFLEPAASGDALLEAVLTGTAPAASGETIHVR